MLNSTKKMMQRCKTFHWNGVSPETRPTGRCSRRIRPIAIERTRVSLNARQTLPITGQLQGLAMRGHHNERSGFIVTCFGWESTIMADLLGFHIGTNRRPEANRSAGLGPSEIINLFRHS